MVIVGILLPSFFATQDSPSSHYCSLHNIHFIFTITLPAEINASERAIIGLTKQNLFERKTLSS